jgi:hypothetical protein
MATTEITTDQTSSIQHQADSQAWDFARPEPRRVAFSGLGVGRAQGSVRLAAHRLSSAEGSSGAQVLVRPFRGLSVAYVPRGPFPAADGPLDQRPASTKQSALRARAGRLFCVYEPTCS